MSWLDHEFFRRDPVTCARELIGCTFHWKGKTAKIVETEAYLALGDEACHTWSRPGARNFVQNHSPGAAYVYLNYGMHWLFNILVKGGSAEGFVLFRALEFPIIEKPENVKNRDWMKIGAGPGKLTKVLVINGSDHGIDFMNQLGTGIARGDAPEVVEGPRIGISRSIDLPWRFGEKDSPALSRSFFQPTRTRRFVGISSK
ncbi:MAG: DNA-3-methyladenine glycosylase [Luteolibacter sp.]